MIERLVLPYFQIILDFVLFINGQGVWVDLDMICLNAFDFNIKEYFNR